MLRKHETNLNNSFTNLEPGCTNDNPIPISSQCGHRLSQPLLGLNRSLLVLAIESDDISRLMSDYEVTLVNDNSKSPLDPGL